MLVGVGSDAAIRRAALVDGWVAGGGRPDAFAAGAGRVRAAWSTAGRDGRPRLVALAYGSLLGGSEAAQAVLGSYYGFAGQLAHRVVEGTSTTPASLRSTVGAFEKAGYDELLLFACSADQAESDLVADSLGLSASGTV